MNMRWVLLAGQAIKMARGMCLAGLVVVWGVSSRVSALDWSVEVVDGEGWSGAHASIAVDSNGSPRIAYSHTDPITRRGELRYAERTAHTWDIQPVTTEHTSYVSLAMDAQDNPHVAYRYMSNILRYATRSNSSWTVQTVYTSPNDYGVTTPSIALLQNGQPAIAFYADKSYYRSGWLTYAQWDGETWTTEALEPVPSGSLNGAVSLVVAPNGEPRICYWQRNGDLQYAVRDGHTWTIDTVTNIGLGPMYEMSFAVGPDGRPHISFYDDDSGMKYATLDGLNWVIEQILSRNSGHGNKIAVDRHGSPVIAFSEGGYASLIDGNWEIEYIPGLRSGSPNDLALDEAGNAHIVSYQDRQAWYAHGTPEPAALSLLALGGLAMLRRRRR